MEVSAWENSGDEIVFFCERVKNIIIVRTHSMFDQRICVSFDRLTDHQSKRKRSSFSHKVTIIISLV